MEMKYKRKYKFHRWYSVIYYDRARQRFYVKERLTLKEARGFIGDIGVDPDITHIDIVRRIWSYNIHDGVIDIAKI